MRIYERFPEALGEVKRDLVEMGIKIHPKTYQDKWVAEDPAFDAFELQDYIYRVTQPHASDLTPTQPWADAEFAERMAGKSNPGEAWKLRADVWSQFLQEDGKFGYSYADRIWEEHQITEVVQALVDDNDSRQAFLAIWKPSDVHNLGGVSRVPCSLGYQFQIRQGQLNMMYLQRSADFGTHLINDIYLAALTHAHICNQVNLWGDKTIQFGYYSHWIGSLHIFKKDTKGVF